MQSNQFIKSNLKGFNTLKPKTKTFRRVMQKKCEIFSISDLPSKSVSIMSKPARRSDKENS